MSAYGTEGQELTKIDNSNDLKAFDALGWDL